MSEIFTMGEPMVVFIAEKPGTFSEVENYSRGLAGAELNFSIGVTRLGHTASYFTKLGKDPYGAYIHEFIEKEKIDGEKVLFTEEYLTGSYLKTKVLEGDPAVYYFRKNSAASHICPKDIEAQDLSGVKMVHITGITPALSEDCRRSCMTLAKRAHEIGAMVSFDPNIREKLWKSREEMVQTLNDMAFHSDVVLPGIKEGRILAGTDVPEKIADFYLEHGSKTVIVKLGENGAYYKTKDGAQGTVPGYKPEKIVDTVGAGDAFAAGVVTGLLENLPLDEAVARGNAMGAIIISSKGDNDNLPDRETLFAFQGKQKR